MRPSVDRNGVSSRVEVLERRIALDVGLGSEIAQFSTEAELRSFLTDQAVEQNRWRLGREEGREGLSSGLVYSIDAAGFLQLHLPEETSASGLEISASGGLDAGGPAPFGFVLGNTPTKITLASIPDVVIGPGWVETEIRYTGEEPLSISVGSAGSSIPINAAADGPSGDPNSGADAGDSFSETNTQVIGVDEGDIVESDGEFVYVLSDALLSIIDVRNTAHPRVASRVQLGNDVNAKATEMILDNSRLLVISEFENESESFVFDVPTSQIIATVIDVARPQEPKIVSETEIDGRLFSSRAIEGKAYLVVAERLSYPTPVANPTSLVNEGDPNERTVYVYETEEEYRGRVRPMILDSLPNYSSISQTGEVFEIGLVADSASTYVAKEGNVGSVTSIVTIDMHASQPTVTSGTTMMMDSSREILMSTESLYLFQDNGSGTSIMKFDVDGGSVAPTASGSVPGNMLDQFSADEQDGYLRIATTQGLSNAVYVLEETMDDALEVTGKVTRLAPGERIFAARFLGDRGYVVTFRTVDPLFSIDLSDPSQPKVEGELKIPGFSEYLQPIDEDHLLAIGRDADSMTGVANDLQLSLFDVSDITDPQLVDRYSFEGGRETVSPAEEDHHAFGYFPEYKALAIPVFSEGGAWIRKEGSTREWVLAKWDQSLHVFDVDVESGFTFAGAIDHQSEVQRTIRIGDALYSISRDTLKVNSIEAPGDLWGQVHFRRPPRESVAPASPKPTDIDRVFLATAESDDQDDFDMDGNGLVNHDDVDFLVHAVVGSRHGDTDLNGVVDFGDFLTLAENFGKSGGWAEGDFDGTGEIALPDLLILTKNFGG